VTLHIVAATLCYLVGAFQFDRGLQGRWLVLHRVSGRMAVACGAVVGLTGLWMVRRLALSCRDARRRHARRISRTCAQPRWCRR
jgi:uncharacterized membrane protein YuzA (DUF378 family)